MPGALTFRPATPYSLVTGDANKIEVIENAGASQVEITPHGSNVNILFNTTIANATASNVAAATPTEWPNRQRRHKVDLSKCQAARLMVENIAAFPAGAVMAAQYSTDESTWKYMDDSVGPGAGVVMTGTNVTQVSSWVSIASGAKADVFLRMVVYGGADGTTTQTIGTIELQVR